MAVVKVLGKGQIVIPVQMRRKYRIEPGAQMQIMEYGGIIYLVPPVDDPVKAAHGALPSGPSLAGMVLRERRGDYR